MHTLLAGCRCLYSSVAERQSCKLKVLGSIPSGGCGTSSLQVAMHGGTVNTCVSLEVLIAFLKRRWSCPPASKCAVLSLALGAQVPGVPPAGHRPSVTGRFSRAAPTPLNAGDTLHGTWQRCPPPLADSRSPCCLSSFFYSAHVHRGRRLLLHMHKLVTGCRCLYSSVAERQSCKLKVLGSIPSGGCAASTLQVAMHSGTVNTCVLLAVLIAFLKPRWSCPPTSKCALLSLALGA